MVPPEELSMQSGAAFPSDAFISEASIDRNSDEIQSVGSQDPASGHEELARRRRRWLVQRAQQGETEAFGELYKECYPAVARIVGFYLQGAARDDAVQDTFVRAWSGIGRYKDTGAPFTAWLGGIARHVVGDALRASKRTVSSGEVPEQPVTHELDDNIDLARVMVKLPDPQRQVLELKFLLGWTNEMVAKAMGKSPGAINVLQYRALERMRKLMSR